MWVPKQAKIIIKLIVCNAMAWKAMVKGINVADMSTQPRDHTDAKEMSARTDAELFKVIKDGGQSITKSVLMPPWSSTLSDEEIEDVVKYLHQLCKC